jgi:hypothetical protein
MRVVEKQGQYGPTLHYEEVEEQLIKFELGVRVLPAQYYFQKRLDFTFKKKHEPGDKWPQGGYEVYGPSNETRCFGLDQLVLHPEVVKMRKLKVSWDNRMEELLNPSSKKRGRKPKVDKGEPKPKNPNSTGKRGRPPIDPEQKKIRDADKALRNKLSGGKRGRPKLDPSERKSKPYVPKGTKRGRPALSEKEIKQKEKQQQLRIQNNPDRKRGRPSTLTNEEKQKRLDEKEARALVSGGKRGRPKLYK